jgi:hypothetical protein
MALISRRVAISAAALAAGLALDFGVMGGALLDAATAGAGQEQASAVVRQFAGPDGGAVPDSTIAVGTDSILAVTNATMTLYGKTGFIRDTTCFACFIDSYDPKVAYDLMTQRFFVAGVEQAAGADPPLIHLAVSRTIAPTSFAADQWYFYAFDAQRRGSGRTTDKPDYPQLGIGRDVVTIATLMTPDIQGSEITEELIRVFDKSKLIAGTAITSWTDFYGNFHPPLPDGRVVAIRGFQPAVHFDDEAGTAFMLTTGLENCDVWVWGIDQALGANPSLSKIALANSDCDLPASADDVLPNPPQAGGPPVDAGPDGFAYAIYRNGSIWASRVVRRRYASGVVAGVQWYEIDVTQWPASVRFVQKGTISSEGVWFLYSSAGVDTHGNVAVVMNRFSATTYPTLVMATRRNSDALGSMQAVEVLRNGEGPINAVDSLNNNRFGDYSGVSHDPTDGSVWVFGEYAGASAPATWIANVSFRTPFTDEDLTTGTVIKAIHVTEMRERINAARAKRGLPAYVFTDPTLVGRVARAAHFSELRAALSEIYDAAGRTAPVFGDPVLNGVAIRAGHVHELRQAIVAIE